MDILFPLESIINSEKAVSTRSTNVPVVSIDGILVDAFPSLECMLDRIVEDIRQPEPAYIFSLNIHGANIAHKVPRFKRIMQESDTMICDGMGIVLASRLLPTANLSCRLAAGDYMPALLQRLSDERLTAFFLAGKPGIAEKALSVLAQKVPNHTVVGCHHGYIHDDPLLETQVIETINRLEPDILFIGFGMPLQEYWIHKNRHRLKVRAFFPFGATLDYISFAVPRCPMWLGNLGLEWLFRLWLEPGRLFERYVIGNPSFAMRVLKDWFADPEYSLSRQEAALPQLRSIPSIRMERNLKAGRINNFEGLRGLLAFWVVIGHVLTIAGIQASSMGIFSPLAHGFVAVDVFVIMSGFFIFYLLDRKQETYRPFITRRFLRLFPVYVVCLLMSILLMNISLTDLKSLPWYHPDNQSRIDILESSQQYFLYHFIAHLTMLHGVIPSQWLPYSAFAFIGQAWSISLEWQFYLVAPALMWICKKRKWLLGILTIITTGLLYWQFKGGAYLGFLPNKFPLFLLGILSFWSWKQPKLTPIMLACAGLVFLLTDTLINKLPILIWLSIFFPTSWGWGVLNHTVLLYLGRISYSVYVSHMMILYVMLSALTRLSGLSQPIFLSLVLASVIPLTILISHVLYHRIEKPFIDYGKLECIS